MPGELAISGERSFTEAVGEGQEVRSISGGTLIGPDLAPGGGMVLVQSGGR